MRVAGAQYHVDWMNGKIYVCVCVRARKACLYTYILTKCCMSFPYYGLSKSCVPVWTFAWQIIHDISCIKPTWLYYLRWFRCHHYVRVEDELLFVRELCPLNWPQVNSLITWSIDSASKDNGRLDLHFGLLYKNMHHQNAMLSECELLKGK